MLDAVFLLCVFIILYWSSLQDFDLVCSISHYFWL